jgi:ATP-binding cassette, subfamily B, bacterial
MTTTTKDYSSLHRGLVLKYFWRVMRGYKVSLFIMLITYIIPYALDILIPLQYLKLWNVISDTGVLDVAHAHKLLMVVLVLHLSRWTSRRIGDFTNDYHQANVMAGLRKQAYSYMIGHPSEFFTDNFSGSLVQKINKYARAFEKLLQRFVADGLPIIIRSVGTIVVLYNILPHKYSYLLAVFCFIFIVTGIIMSKFKLKYDLISAENDSKTVGALADSIGNHPSIQLFTGHDFERAHVGEVIDAQYKSTVFNWYLWDSIFSFQALYCIGIEIGIFWFAIGDWQAGLIGLPVFILLQSYLSGIIGTLWNWAGIVRTYYEGFSDAQEMAVILDLPYGVNDKSAQTLPEKVQGDIVFDNVTYIYNKNNTKVLDEFNLTIPHGQKLALVGPSGSGKTTFVRLIMRIFDVTSGSINIDGVNISSVTQESLRSNIAFVPQDPSLFHRTILENIRYGRRDATDEEVKRAAALAHCDDFIDKLPLGYETFVGERGVKLSGGERQRVAIARAILKDAPILILDEATSALDSHSEMLIQDALHTLIKGKTTIVIAHRLSTIREMDRIIVLQDGKIIEDNTHEYLIANEGLYKKLWDIQAGGFKTDAS